MNPPPLRWRLHIISVHSLGPSVCFSKHKPYKNKILVNFAYLRHMCFWTMNVRFCCCNLLLVCTLVEVRCLYVSIFYMNILIWSPFCVLYRKKNKLAKRKCHGKAFSNVIEKNNYTINCTFILWSVIITKYFRKFFSLSLNWMEAILIIFKDS